MEVLVTLFLLFGVMMVIFNMVFMKMGDKRCSGICKNIAITSFAMFVLFLFCSCGDDPIIMPDELSPKNIDIELSWDLPNKESSGDLLCD